MVTGRVEEGDKVLGFEQRGLPVPRARGPAFVTDL
jgi:hypothetical protein